MDGKSVRDELAELTGAVRELRDREIADVIRELRAEVAQLRAERAVHHCHGCSCVHMTWAYSPAPIPSTYPAYPTVICGDTASLAGGTVTTSGTLTLNTVN
jgi:hypothetical protein